MLLTVAEGIPPRLAVLRPLLRSPAPTVGGVLPTPAMDLVVTGEVATNNNIYIPPGLRGFNRVEVNGVYYTRSPSPTPGRGQYWYDIKTGQIILGGELIPTTGITAYFFMPVHFYPVDRLYEIESLFKDWAIGPITYQIRLGEPPEISNVAFQCFKYEQDTLETLLNTSVPLTIAGHIYYPTGRTVQEKPYQNTVKISCGFNSEFKDHPIRCKLDKPIKIKRLITYGDDGNYYTSLDIASAAGVSYVGEIITVYVPRKVSSAATTTLRQVLSRDRLLANSCFVRYDSNSVEVVKWNNVAIYPVLDDDLIGEERPTLNYTGDGFALNDIPLLTELNCAVLELDTSKDNQPGDKIETKISGDEDPESPPTVDMGTYRVAFDTQKLRSPGQCFDNGGPTKKKITTRLQNGFPLTEKEELYGFAYSSLDIYDWTPNIVAGKQNGFNLSIKSGVSPDNLWQLVKTTTKTYVYDDDGYLTQITTSVRELNRILKETDALEAINARANFLNTGTKNLQSPKNAKEDYEARLYQLSAPAYAFEPIDITYTAQSTEAANNTEISNDLFSTLAWNPWRTYTFTELRNQRDLADFYADIRKPDPDETDWIAPKFLEKRELAIDNTVIVPDPRTTQKEKKPPLIFGESIRQNDRVEIVSAKDPERYKTISVNTSQRGEGLGQAATDRRVVPNTGRPQPVERLETYGRRASSHTDEDTPRIKYLVTTIGVSPRGVESTTIRFPGCYTLAKAQAALQTYLLQENLNALTCTLNFHTPQPQWRCGDQLIYDEIVWRILSITNNLEIAKDGTLRQRKYTVQLGIDYGEIPFTTDAVSV